MTLPASLPLSMSQIAAELGLSLPLSLEHPWVANLSQANLPRSFSNLLGKTGRFDGSITPTQSGTGQNTVYHVSFSSAPFFGGTLSIMNENLFGAVNITTNSAPNWTGNISVKNNTTGASAVLAYQGGSPPQWGGTGSGNLIPGTGQAYSFTILPSN